MDKSVTHTYYKTQKITNSIEQKTIEEKRMITMDKEKITTRHREFLFKNVFDVSFRSLQGEEGLLYLHTNQGVYSYMVKSDPSEFIAAFKELDKE
ncbi:hypothetical protein [Alteribacter aurantiacus]|uniref:hypothetical protein n=1 Tax=Alteribacter aurantiacus TaxID=254410 RepID=UPI0004255ACB|nr:hypothetical protein [Alteribacter aurantiacus]